MIVIDNYDSFTFNVVQYLWELGATVDVYRNDEKTLTEILAEKPDRILISPGPCTPNEAGISVPLVHAAADARIPLLGVCLGHQSIAQAFGGVVEAAPRLMHGKTSVIRHDKKGVFTDIPDPFTATRYHSLTVSEDLPACLEATAWTCNDAYVEAHGAELMGIRHRSLPIEGVQFHPESFLTQCGKDILRNFLAM